MATDTAKKIDPVTAIAIACAGSRREYLECPSHWREKAVKIIASDRTRCAVHNGYVNYRSMEVATDRDAMQSNLSRDVERIMAALALL